MSLNFIDFLFRGRKVCLFPVYCLSQTEVVMQQKFRPWQYYYYDFSKILPVSCEHGIAGALQNGSIAIVFQTICELYLAMIGSFSYLLAELYCILQNVHRSDR